MSNILEKEMDIGNFRATIVSSSCNVFDFYMDFTSKLPNQNS